MLIRGILGITRSIAKKSISSKTITEVSAAIHAGRLVILPATSGYIIVCQGVHSDWTIDISASSR